MNFDYGYDYNNDPAFGGGIRPHSNGNYTATVVTVSTVTIADKNGVKLCEYLHADKVDHYEIFIDNEFFSKYADLKTAKAMFKDFSA